MPISGKKPDKDWKILDKTTLATIGLTLALSVTFNIVNKRTIKELMTVLCIVYEKPSALNKVYLMRRLFNLQRTESQPVYKHLNEYNTIMTQFQ